MNAPKSKIILTFTNKSQLKNIIREALENFEKSKGGDLFGENDAVYITNAIFKEITQFYEKIVFYSDSCLSSNIEDWHNLGNINKIITTNSMPQVFQKRLQILDCYDIFNDYLKGE